ncbi:type II toxin-antitoxin system RelE/ParE family toxin [Streptomyces sp. HNM0663]|uniref:Type II toxin-antitoxin system RelE/ParE family toxin n=1 Tax=Streptomyces chengmaiensis TaxID=3040919 RepID=A0ABT6HMP0_9ACTN|nr:type II toxin-antitoxin system RelE/ParE family toxin [Streptomyces chengmaiensis]MDH2389626.1 type II toxin-antitoxin system RelE/ParE family toxin [Streptomyces chengmaiensis]
MKHTVIWETSALRTLKDLKAEDPDGARTVRRAVDRLAFEPFPPGSNKVSASTYRLRTGPYRITYQVDGATVSVTILMVGSL